MAEKSNVKLLWKIENFSHCVQEKQECLESPEFHINCLAESTWKLLLYPRGINNSNAAIKVYLYNISFQACRVVFMDYEISFLSADGSVLFKEKIKDKEVSPGESYEISSYPTVDEIREKKDDFLSQNTLTIQCRIWKLKKNFSHSLNYFALTRIGIQQRFFHYKVAEFSKLKINDRKVYRFIMDKDQPTFVTEIFLTDAFVEFEIKQISKNISKLFATGKLSMVSRKGEIVRSMEGFHWFKTRDSIWQFPRFLAKNQVRANAEFMVDDTLHLLFDLTLTTGIVYSNIESISFVPTWLQKTSTNTTGNGEASQRVSSNQSLSVVDDQIDGESLAILQVDLLSLYKDKTLSDFELRTGSKSFPVHKSVLAARSPVFKAMFTSGMKEGSDEFLDIPDLGEDVLDRLLLFVYTGNLEELEWSSASSLYYAADKYDILYLKEKCCTFLTNNMVNSNVCEMLILSDQHNDERLKYSVQEFITRNDKEIIRSDEWKKFVKEYAVLAAETLQLIYSKKLDLLD